MKKKSGKSKFQYSLPEKADGVEWQKMYSAIWKRMQEIVFDLKPKLILELGTNVGHSTRIFLEAMMQCPRPGHIITVDIKGPKWQEWQMKKYEGHFTAVESDSLSLAFDDREIDILYIDSLHTYEHVLKELKLYVQKVKKGGKVLLHDVSKPDDGVEAIEQIPRIESNNSESKQINKAINEFLKNKNYRYEVVLGHSGLGVIHVD